MSRRETLRMLAAAAATGIGLAGCGGGGFGGTTTPGGGGALVTTTTKSTLPAGLKIPVSQLKGETAWGSNPLNPDGSFSSRVDSSGNPTIAFVRDAKNDKHVLTGLAGAGGVSAKSSAVVLLALSMGLFGLPPKQAQQGMDLLQKDPATATLANVISTRVAANPYALFSNDAQIMQALKAAIQTIIPKTSRFPAPTTRQAGASDLLLIQPGDQSMTRVVQTDADSGIKVVNLGRRPITALTYKVATENDAGVRTELAKPVLVGGSQQISATTGIIGSLASLGQSAVFGPVEGPALELPAQTGVKKTFYETVVLMASGKQDGLDPDPAFFGETKYSTFVDGWRQERRDLNIHVTFGGILHSMIAAITGSTIAYLARNVAIAAANEIEAAAVAAGTSVIARAAQGAYGFMIKDAMTVMAQSDLIGLEFRKDVMAVYLRAQGAVSTAVSEAQLVALRGLAAMVVEILAVVGSLVALADFGFTYNDALTSSKGERWTETVLTPSVLIDPKTVKMRKGAEQVFTAKAVGATGKTLRYKWTLTGGLGTLSEQGGAVNVGRTIETTSTAVKLVTTPSDQGTLTVAVEAFIIQGTSRTSLGVAKASVTFETVSDQPVGVNTTFEERDAGTLPSEYGYFNFAIEPGFIYTIKRKSFPGVYDGSEFQVSFRYSDVPEGPTQQGFVYLRNWVDLGPAETVQREHVSSPSDVFFLQRKGTENILHHTIEIGSSNVAFRSDGYKNIHRLTGAEILLHSESEAIGYLTELAAYQHFAVTRRPE